MGGRETPPLAWPPFLVADITRARPQGLSAIVITVWPWASYTAFLCISFLISKMRVMSVCIVGLH